MSNIAIINNELVKIEKRFVELTNKETWEREKSYAIQIISKNKSLQGADITTVMQSILNVANIGLSLNPALKLAYLIPRFQGGITCCLEASYQGLVKLITDSGSAKNVYAYPVYEGDDFQETLGTNIDIVHKPNRKTTNIILFYAVAVLHDGSKQVEVMTIGEINEIRERSESYKAFVAKKVSSCIWVNDYSEMARKTVIRRLCKYLPKTDMFEKLASAIKLDEEDYTISDIQFDLIEQLLINASLDINQKQKIEQEMAQYSSTEANKTIAYLKDNQTDPISSGRNYSQTDINNRLKQM